MRTVHLLCLAALSFCTINCLPIQEETIQIDNTRDKQRDQHRETKISSFYYFLVRFSKRMRKAIYQDLKGAVSLRKRRKDCFSALRIKSNNAVCLDIKKKPYISVDAIKDYLCHKMKGKNSNYALCTWSGHALKLVEAYSASESPPHSNSNEKPIHLRPRRNQHFDAFDPLGSENPRSRTTNYCRQNREQERERTSNVSKETIISYDDPLHALLSKRLQN